MTFFFSSDQSHTCLCLSLSLSLLSLSLCDTRLRKREELCSDTTPRRRNEGFFSTKRRSEREASAAESVGIGSRDGPPTPHCQEKLLHPPPSLSFPSPAVPCALGASFLSLLSAPSIPFYTSRTLALPSPLLLRRHFPWTGLDWPRWW